MWVAVIVECYDDRTGEPDCQQTHCNTVRKLNLHHGADPKLGAQNARSRFIDAPQSLLTRLVESQPHGGVMSTGWGVVAGWKRGEDGGQEGGESGDGDE